RESGEGALGRGPLPRWERLHRELVADRQAADPLAGGREDRVAQRGWNRRHARLADATHRLAVVTRDDVHADLPRRPDHAGHLVGIEVVLLHAPVLEADLAQR